ncbi:hypothetical protein BSKO_08590 [Bryopsis sp. KO-2023]|nr:hypothetical protein BSKO_08590 [Bryopsis sp. KO-2023]
MRPESLIQQIQTLSGTQEDLLHLLGLLSKNENFVLQNHLVLLEGLSPSQHSLAYLFILWSWSNDALNANGDAAFMTLASVFLRECTEMQVSLAPGKFCSVCRAYKHQALKMRVARRAILPLRDALEKLLPTKEHISPVHVDFLQICMTTKHYSAVGDLLERDIYEVDPEKTSLTLTDFLLYCYYGARVCIGLKKFPRAMELLYLAIVAPSMVPNAIMVMSYKLFLLLSLIRSGTVQELPKYTASSIQRVLKGGECEAYIALGEAFGTHEGSVLDSCIEKHSEVFETDNTVGLVKQVLASLVKRNILRLTRTYVTLSLADIAGSVGLPSADSAEMYVLKMIEAGEIHAEISEVDGMVRFMEDPEAYDNVEMAEHLDKQMLRCTELDRKLHEVHEELLCDRDYLTKVVSKEARLDANDLGVRA